MITLSSDGIFTDDDGGKILPTKKRVIADVCGAGDAVISATALGIAIDMELPKIVTSYDSLSKSTAKISFEIYRILNGKATLGKCLLPAIFSFARMILFLYM